MEFVDPATVRRRCVAGLDEPESARPLRWSRAQVARRPHPRVARLAMVVSWITLDALITAGIAANRAEAVRWALARIRERPAYAQLRERAREIERLKTEF